MAENQLINGSEYVDSESATARELPDPFIVDNFESGILASNESESNLQDSKDIFNEEIA